MSSAIKILIVEDTPAFLLPLQELLEKEEDFQIVGYSSGEEDAPEIVCKKSPDIVLIDLHSERFPMDGIQLSRRLRIETDVKTLLLLENRDPGLIIRAFREGFASSCLFRNQCSLLTDTIRVLAQGNTAQEYISMFLAMDSLSKAETSVFWLMMGKDIGLRSAPKTIANQKRRVMRKLGLKNQEELCHIFRLFQEDGKEGH